MDKELNAEALAKQAERLYVDAALMLTRLDKQMRRAVRLVLVDGLTQTEAAKKVHRRRQNVYRAILKVGPKLDLVKQHDQQPG